MEESIPRLPENSRNFVVVVSHELRLWRLLGESKEAMDVLNSLKRLLETKTTTRVSDFI